MCRFRIPKAHLMHLHPCSYLIILTSGYVLVLNTMLNVTWNYQERDSPARFLFFCWKKKRKMCLTEEQKHTLYKTPEGHSQLRLEQIHIMKTNKMRSMRFKPSYLRRFSCLWICIQVYVFWAISLDFLLKLHAKTKLAIGIKKIKKAAAF